MIKNILLSNFLIFSLIKSSFGVDLDNSKVNSGSIEFFDYDRNLPINISFYFQADLPSTLDLIKPLVVINGDYGLKNDKYSFIANALANNGYNVISIQQDLKGHFPILRPKKGDIFHFRKPFWQVGVDNILFIISELRRKYLFLNLDQIILIGDSNGGDISMMYAEKYPEEIAKIISLNSLYYPFSTKDKIPILALKSSEIITDYDIIPESENIKIVNINAKQDEISDNGSEKIKEEILKNIIKFLDN